MTVCTVITARTPHNIDRKADTAKAIRLVETGETMTGRNLLTAAFLFSVADTINGNDTVVTLATNNFDIMLSPNMNPLYYPQLEILDATPDAPMTYYYTMIKAVPPMEETIDSLAFFNTALRAYRRFPRQDIFTDNLLSQGVFYLRASRFKEVNDEIVDTLDLTPAHIAFADSLLLYADRIEKDNGYSYSVDRARAAVYTILDRKDDIKALTLALEQRDSTDIQALDLLTSLAYNRGDSVGVFDLGLRRFEIDPEGEHVFSLYQAVTNDTLRSRLANAVLTKAMDTDIDPETRLNILRALAEAYYSNNSDLEEPVELMNRISDTIEEISAEDPSDIIPYVQGIALVKSPYWLKNYGYRHWVNMAEAIGEEDGEIQVFAAAIVPHIENQPTFEKSLVKLRDIDIKKHPELVIDANLTLAQYYYNSKLYQKALDILQPITLQALQENLKLRKEAAAAADADRSDTPDFDDGDEDQISRFVLIQSLISECQMNLGQVDNALATLNHIIAIDPENAEALNNLAYYMCENDRDLTIALSLADRSLEYEPNNFNAIDTHSWILYRRGDIDGAWTDMEKLFSNLGIDLGADLFTTGNEKSARDVLEEKTNIEVITPILGHALIIASKKDNIEPAALWQIADILTDWEPDNKDLKDFLDTHKRP